MARYLLSGLRGFRYHGAAILCAMFGGAGPKRFVGDHRLPVSVGYLIRLVHVVSAIGVLLGIFIRLAPWH